MAGQSFLRLWRDTEVNTSQVRVDQTHRRAYISFLIRPETRVHLLPPKFSGLLDLF